MTQDKLSPKYSGRFTDLMSALQEIKQLKRQLKVAEEEREILKKATAYFARNS